MNRLAPFVLLTSILLLAACVPERVVWSPDGTRAAILAEDGVHLADLEGNLGPVIAQTGQVKEANAVAWLPDGKRFLVLHGESLATWQEISAALPEHAKAVAANTDLLQRERTALLQAVATTTAPSDFALTLPGDSEDTRWAAIFLRDHEADTLKPKIGERWTALAALTLSDAVVQLCTLTPTGADAGPPLWRGESQVIYNLRVSPTGTVAAITASEGDHDRKSALSLLSLTDGKRIDLGEGALYPDWSPDGHQLLYIKPAGAAEGKDAARLGLLVRQRVLDDAGQPLFAAGATLPADESLVGLLFDDRCRVRVAKDGRVFFAAAEITLPTTPDDFTPKPSLFCIDPGKLATVSRVIPRSADAKVGDAAPFFELSPDATHISIPFEDGRVSVLDLATGGVDLVQPLTIGGGEGQHLTSTPSWRPTATGGELTFVAPAQDRGPATDVVRYSLSAGKGVGFSEKWNEAARGDWLKGPATTAP